MKTKVLLLMLAFVLPTLGSANEAEPSDDEKANHAFGGSLGWLTGNGIMYRRYLGNNYVQAGAIAYYNKDSGEKYGDLALTMGRYIHYTDFSNQFFPVALKVFAGGELEVGKKTFDRDSGRDLAHDYVHAGAGVGLDIGSPNQAGFAFSFDLAYIASFRDYNELVFIEPRPGASIFYNFK